MLKKMVGKSIIEVDTKYFRPTEVDMLIGDASKAKDELGWSPKYTLKDIVKEMVLFDLEKNYKELILKQCGFNVPKSCEL